jgi:hypothetical protein
MSRFNIAIAVVLSSLSMATAANATVVNVAVAGAGLDTNVGMNFNSIPANNVANAPSPFTIGDWTFTNASQSVQVLNLVSATNGAQPFGTTGNYLSVLAGGQEDVSFSPRSSFAFFWGSIDDSNKITVLTTNGNQSFTGAQIASMFTAQGVQSTGCQTLTNCNRYFTFTDGDLGQNIVGFDVTSGVNSFELTNISAVPEPGTWAMLIVGFLGVGFLSYRKSSKSSTVRFRLI